MGNVIAKHDSAFQPRMRTTRVSGAFGRTLETTLKTEGGDCIPVAVRFLVDAIEVHCMLVNIDNYSPSSVGSSWYFSGSC